MPLKFTETQLMLLSAASQREEHCLTPPPAGAPLGLAKKAAAKLLEKGFVREVRARKGAPIWRRNGDAGRALALKLTAAGLRAIAAEPDVVDREDASTCQGEDAGGRKTSKDAIDTPKAAPEGCEETARLHVPRAGTKISAVIDLLGRDAGATIDELVAATGWLPHTTRAALTGLRKRGLAVNRRNAQGPRAGAYVIAERNGLAQS
jgi:Protein of unknown function (DUF3489)